MILLQAPPPNLPANAPWWAFVIIASLPGVAAIIIAIIQRKKKDDGVGDLTKTLTEHGGALGDLRSRIEKVERAPAAGASQARAALAKVAALEGWRRQCEERDERRRDQQHQDDLKLERLLGRIETKLETLEQEDAGDRRSRS